MKNATRIKVLLIRIFLITSSIYLLQNVSFAQAVYCPAGTSYVAGTCATQLGYQSYAKGNYSLAAGYQALADKGNAVALGYIAQAYGNLSLALGQETYANNYGYAIGIKAKANIDNSFAIGRNITNNAINSIVIGASSNSSYPLTNSISNSISFGINVNDPTLFIKGADVPNTVQGKVGIGTASPLTNLHILSGTNENATLYVQTKSFTGSFNASLQLGNQYHSIIADPTNGLSFKTQRYYLFNDGNVGIGTSSPTAKLHVVGSTNLLGSLQVGQSLGKVNSIFYGKVGIGTASPQTDLQINGSVSVGYESVLPSEAKSLIVSGYVGIGTFSPTVPLDVKGKIMATEFQLASGYMNGYILQSDESGNAHWVNPTTVNTGIWQQNGINVTVDNTKKVGIGTATPAEPLHVAGNVLVTGDIKGAHNDWHSLNLYGNSSGDDGAFITIGNNSSGTASIKLFARGENGRVEFHNQNIQVMSIRADNNVYIGNPDVNSNLFVNGEITANLVRVNTQSWWDCVFDDEYKLQPLNELETYIRQNKHLPDIPSEDEIKANGIDVAQMNALLLKKVEELTLYVIELEKKINTIRAMK